MAGLDGRKISPHRDSIPDRPARSQSLYRLKTGERKSKKRGSSRATTKTQHDNHVDEDYSITVLPECNTCLADTNGSPDNHSFTSFRTAFPMILLTLV